MWWRRAKTEPGIARDGALTMKRQGLTEEGGVEAQGRLERQRRAACPSCRAGSTGERDQQTAVGAVERCGAGPPAPR
jgi:hypothetical protein